ncbi:MAG: NUDIX hydrolase [Planctomycetaceae bacterium]
MAGSEASVAVDLVVFAIRGGRLEALLIRRGSPPFKGKWALPGGFVLPDEGLEEAARRELAEETGLSGLYLEQLFSFGDPRRDPRGRVIGVAYFAVVPPSKALPVAGSDAAGAAFHPAHDAPPLAFDHAAILAKAVDRLRTKTEYSTVPLRLLDEPFTLTELQQVYEVLLERPLDKRNFRKKMLALGAVVETRGARREGAHRPAKLYRLSPSRPNLLKERGILFPF